MTPLYFTNGGRRLFGAYDPARSSRGGKRAAVICQPWGGEYIHAHRTLRQLAIRLSQSGFHVLRFDYHGTGDSAGDTGENSAAGCRDDVRSAIAELTEISGVTRTTLLGLRLGACFAAEVAATRSRDVEALVLWDPVSNIESQSALAASGVETPKEFSAVDLASLRPMLPERTLLLTTQERSRMGVGEMPVDFVPSPPPWIEERMETGVIPVNVLQYIVNWLR